MREKIGNGKIYHSSANKKPIKQKHDLIYQGDHSWSNNQSLNKYFL